MARHAVARDIIFALRREIAKIEGRPAQTLDGPANMPAGDAGIVLRRAGRPEARLMTGIAALDAALGGGLSRAALTEIHSGETRDAGLAAAFALALAALDRKTMAAPGPLLWIGTAEIFREAGAPYAPGFATAFGFTAGDLLVAEAERFGEALWIAEEAARLPALSAVVLELRGNPKRLDLTATRRLHRRAADAARPVFLLRQAAIAEPTAAPVRLSVSPAPATPRHTLSGPLRGSLGNPAFCIALDKTPGAFSGRLLLEWNSHDLAFRARHATHPRRLVSLPGDGADLAPAAGTVVALDTAGQRTTPDRLPAREQRAEDRGARRAG